MKNVIDSEMCRIIQRNLLRYAVGRAIFCPSCEAILDVRRAVLFDSRVLCGACFDRILARASARDPEGVARNLAAAREASDYLDGRVLFAPRKRAPKAVTP